MRALITQAYTLVIYAININCTHLFVTTFIVKFVTYMYVTYTFNYNAACMIAIPGSWLLANAV